MKPLQYLHPRRSRKKMPEEKEHKRGDSWNRVEQVARISAQFAAALAVVGGLLGVVTVTMVASFVSGFQKAKQVPVGRFVNLLSPPVFESIAKMYSSFASLNFWAIFIALLIVILLIGLVWFGIIFINRKNRAISWIIVVGLMAGLVYYQIKAFPTQPDNFRKLWGVLSPYFWSLAFFALWRIMPTKVAKVLLLFGVIFGFVFVFNLFTLSIEVAAYSSQNIGWTQGVQEICESPQIIFLGERGRAFSGQRVFLLLRTDTEYYVFTTTVPAIPPSLTKGILPKDIANLALVPLSEGCSPASITVLSAADVGTVTLIYDEQVKPGECCYRLHNLPTPTPIPVPSATPGP